MWRLDPSAHSGAKREPDARVAAPAAARAGTLRWMTIRQGG
jgi:hypothetical protein